MQGFFEINHGKAMVFGGCESHPVSFVMAIEKSRRFIKKDLFNIFSTVTMFVSLGYYLTNGRCWSCPIPIVCHRAIGVMYNFHMPDILERN